MRLHWWKILDLHPKKEIFLFDSFGLKGLKSFTIQGDKKLINKILLGLEKFIQAGNKFTLVERNFSRTEYEKIAKKELGKLSTTARDLFYFVNEFGKLYNVTDEISTYFLYDQIQKSEIDTCDIFQLYFYENLFVPPSESLIVNDEKLKKNYSKAIE